MTEREHALLDVTHGLELILRGVHALNRLSLPPPTTSLGLTSKPPVPKPQESTHGTR
jgi:hypothetical protein